MTGNGGGEGVDLLLITRLCNDLKCLKIPQKLNEQSLGIIKTGLIPS